MLNTEQDPLLHPSSSPNHPPPHQQYVHPITDLPPPAVAAAGTTTTPFKLNALQRTAVTSFSVVRIARGLCFLAWPALGLSSFDIPESGATFLLGCLLGSRDLLIGGLLWTADTTSRRETSRAVLISLLGDALDTCILIFSAACAWHWRNPVVEILAVALLAIAEHLTLYSMSEDEFENTKNGGGAAAAYSAGLQAMEDKKRRMDAWLAEMRVAEAAQQQQAVPYQQPPQYYYYRTAASTVAPPASTIAPESVV